MALQVMRNLDPTLHIFHHASIPMTSLRIAALSSGLLLSACSSLGPFKEADTNQDGGVSRDEAAVRSEDLASLFNTADEDKDGVLNEEEYEFVRAFLQKSRTSTHQGTARPRTSGSGGGGGGGHSH